MHPTKGLHLAPLIIVTMCAFGCGSPECPAMPLDDASGVTAWEHYDWFNSVEPCEPDWSAFPSNRAMRLTNPDDAAALVDDETCTAEELANTPLANRLSSLPPEQTMVGFEVSFGGCLQDPVLEGVYRSGDDIVIHVLLADLTQRSDFSGGCTLDAVSRMGVIIVEEPGVDGAKMVSSRANPDTCGLVVRQ